MAAKHQLNRQITVSPLTVITPDGSRYGPISRLAAFDLAAQYGLDLVLMSVEPPVAKLMDYGRYLFDEKKAVRAREQTPEAKRRAALTDVKELTLSYKIADHDLMVIVSKSSAFILKGHRVKLTIRLRGREARHHQLATELLLRLAELVEPEHKIERTPFVDGTKIMMILVP